VKLALIHSQQPANQYVGGATGTADSEQAWMRKLALQLAPLLRAYSIDVVVGPLGTSYADNVAWVNRLSVDRLLSLHSNAMGNACILYGTSAASRAYAEAMQRELNAAKLLPFGDAWEFNERKVAEVSSTKPPAVLLEVGQHDLPDYAQWLRDNITSGALAEALAGPIARALGGVKPSTPLASTTPLPEEDIVTKAQADRIIELLELIAERALVTADAVTVGREGVKFDGDVIAALRAIPAVSSATPAPVTLTGGTLTFTAGPLS